MTNNTEVKNLYSRLKGLYKSNPSIECNLLEKEVGIVIRHYLSLENSVTTFIMKSRDVGYSIATSLNPGLTVPEETRENVLEYLNRVNRKMIRGYFVLDEDNDVRFDSFIPLCEGNVISDDCLADEIMLGDHIFMNFIQRLMRAIDGESVEDKEESKEKSDSNKKAPVDPENEMYVPSNNAKEQVGAMYG